MHGGGGRAKTAQTGKRQKRFDKAGIHCRFSQQRRDARDHRRKPAAALLSLI
jgi:hypothetical protein